jgi:hypothetical protein
MRYAIVAVILAIVGWTPLLASGAGKPITIPEPVKCFQCEGNQCHAVYGPGSQTCFIDDGGCQEFGPCGSDIAP